MEGLYGVGDCLRVRDHAGVELDEHAFESRTGRISRYVGWSATGVESSFRSVFCVRGAETSSRSADGSGRFGAKRRVGTNHLGRVDDFLRCAKEVASCEQPVRFETIKCNGSGLDGSNGIVFDSGSGDFGAPLGNQSFVAEE